MARREHLEDGLEPVRGNSGAPAGLGVASLSGATAVLPAFMLGTLAVLIRRDLEVSPGQVGLGIALLFGAAAAASPIAGRLVERMGFRISMRLAALVSAIVLASLAAAQQVGHVLVAMPIGGLGLALSIPAVSASVAEQIPHASHGFALGVTKSAGPAASMVAGLAVPLIATQWGWRSAFLAGLPLAILVLVNTRKPSVPVGQMAPAPLSQLLGLRTRGSLGLLALAMGLGVAAGNSSAAFLVDAASAAGFNEAVGGTILATASLAGIASRLVLGWITDRYDVNLLRSVAFLMIAGASGLAALPLATTTPALVVASTLALGTAWGWTGLLALVVIRVHPGRPAAATGITSTGMFLGATLGPLSFGVVSQRLGFAMMWYVGSLYLVAGAVVIGLVLRRMRAGCGHSGQVCGRPIVGDAI